MNCIKLAEKIELGTTEAPDSRNPTTLNSGLRRITVLGFLGPSHDVVKTVRPSELVDDTERSILFPAFDGHF